MPAPAPSLLPGQSPPYFTITPSDQAGVIFIVTLFCLILSVIFILIRAYVRIEARAERFARDDSVLAASLVCFAVQSAVVFYEIHAGLGKTLDKLGGRQIASIQESMFADDVFYILSVWLSKASSALLYSKLSGKRSHHRAVHGLLILFAVTGIASLLVLTLRCDISRAWVWFNQNGITCHGVWPRWQVIAAFDIITEVALAAMAIYLVWGLQMDFSRKAAVVFAFDLRLLMVLPIIFHLHYVSVALNSVDPSLASTYFTVCKQAEIVCGIAAANIASLRPFINATATNYGASAEGPRTQTGSKSGGSAALSSFKKLSSKVGLHSSAANSQMQSRAEGHEEDPLRSDAYTNEIRASSQPASDPDRRDSREMIIRKDVQYFVEYDSHSSSSRA